MVEFKNVAKLYHGRNYGKSWPTTTYEHPMEKTDAQLQQSVLSLRGHSSVM